MTIVRMVTGALFRLETTWQVSSRERPVSRDLPGCARSGDANIWPQGGAPQPRSSFHCYPNKSSLYDVNGTGSCTNARANLFPSNGNSGLLTR